MINHLKKFNLGKFNFINIILIFIADEQTKSGSWGKIDSYSFPK